MYVFINSYMYIYMYTSLHISVSCLHMIFCVCMCTKIANIYICPFVHVGFGLSERNVLQAKIELLGAKFNSSLKTGFEGENPCNNTILVAKFATGEKFNAARHIYIYIYIHIYKFIYIYE